jgi:hypothetical protein
VIEKSLKSCAAAVMKTCAANDALIAAPPFVDARTVRFDNTPEL